MKGAWSVPRDLRPDLDIEALERYAGEIERWNRSIRLVGPRDVDGIRGQIADALLPFLLAAPAFPLLDVGSGAGLPGIAVAIAFPGETVVCMEPNAKKASFLRNAVRLLSLSGVRIVMARAEEALRDFPELASSFATVTARAVAEPEGVLPLLEPYLFPAGRALLPRGREPGPPVPGWHLTCDRPYEGPAGVGPRRLLVYERSA